MKTNNVILIGYVGADPTIKILPGGIKKAMIRMATHMPGKNEKGEKIWNTVWHEIIAWGTKAAYAERSFVKGSKILIDGMIKYRTYKDQTGHTRYVTNIIAGSLLNLDR